MRTPLLLILFALTTNLFATELSKREKKVVAEIEATIRAAAKEYSSDHYEQAGEAVRQAMQQLDLALQEGSPDLFEVLQPAINRVARAHTLIEFEGITLPPFRPPSRPQRATGTPQSKPNKTNPSPTKTPPSAEISFSETVAPILVNRCGRCHVAQSKGKFNMGTYAALIRGTPDGVVVFAGDSLGSRLIETIESGDMPRGGGKVSPDELRILKDWIELGAKFDGVDPSAAIDSRGAARPQAIEPTQLNANPPADAEKPSAQRSAGKGTVSFAKDVASLLVQNCNGCHLQATNARGGLLIDTYAQLLRGGDSGKVIDPDRGEASLLVRKLRGTVGARMPAGGRPPLSDESIALIAKWIDEGATLDGASETQPLTVMSQLAWAAAATPAQIGERRQANIERNLSLVVGAGQQLNSKATENFLVIGPVAIGTIELVAELAESALDTTTTVIPDGDRPPFRGRATIAVLPKRYDYSEFARMIEQRSLPTEWTGHWKSDGIDAYVAIIASDDDDRQAISARLAAPIVSLALATQGSGIPKWLAEGIGSTLTQQKSSRRDREAARKSEAEFAAAFAAINSAKQFLDGKLTPQQSEQIGAAVAASILEGKRRRSFDRMMRLLVDGTPFDEAFSQTYGMTVEGFIQAWRAGWGR